MNIFSQKQMEDIASGIWYTSSWPDFRQALNKPGASVQIPSPLGAGMAGLKAITNCKKTTLSHRVAFIPTSNLHRGPVKSEQAQGVGVPPDLLAHVSGGRAVPLKVSRPQAGTVSL